MPLRDSGFNLLAVGGSSITLQPCCVMGQLDKPHFAAVQRAIMNQVDKDTMKILQDMQAEGKELPDAAKGIVDTPDEEADETPEEAEESGESNDSEESGESPDDEESESSEDDDAQGDESEDTQERVPQKRERPVPTWSMVKKLEKELEAERAKNKDTQQSAPDMTADELESLAKETKADPEALRKLEAYFEKKFGSKGLILLC